MKKAIIFLGLFCYHCVVGAAEMPYIPDATVKKDQLALLDNLIEVTEQNLEKEKELKNQVKEYLQIQTQYLKNQNDKEITLRMVKSAHRVLGLIKETHLIQSFDPEFISELNFFSQIAQKRGLPKP